MKTVNTKENENLNQELLNLQTTLDNIGTYVFTKDLEGKYTYVNELVRQLFDYPIDEIIGYDDSKFFSIDLSNDFRLNDQKVMCEGIVLEAEEKTVISKTNEVKYYKTVKKPLYDNSHKIIGMFGVSTDITDQKNMEAELTKKTQELEAANERYNKALSATEDGIWDWIVPTNAVYYSPTWKSMLGFSDDEVENSFEGWEKLVHPDDKEFIVGEVMKLANGDYEEFNVQFRMKCKDDTYKWIYSRAKGLDRDENGKPLRITGTHVDMQKFKEHEAKYISYLNLASDGIHILDVSGNVIECSKSFADTLGYTVNEILNLNIIDWDVGIDPDKLLPSLNQIIEIPRLIETKHKRKDGSIIDVQINAKRIDIDGNSYVYASQRDITDQKINEKKMKLASNIYASMTDGIVVTDENQKIIEVNERYCKNSGYSEEELLDKNTNFLSSGWHDNDFYEKMWNDLKLNDSWSGEIIDRKKNGEVYICETTILILRDEQGSIINYVAIQNDITEKKAREDLVNNLAYYDVLTKLPNRLHFEDHFNNRLAVAKRKDEKLALFFIDLDNFKTINDTYGHIIGDYFLKDAAKRLKRTVREEDTVARLGGDEFAILIEDFDTPSDLNTIATKIIHIFKEAFNIKEKLLYSGSSIGIAIYPYDGITYNELMQSADTAMYTIKNNSKSGAAFFTSSMNESITQQTLIENALRNALKNNELFLVYQPKIDTEQGLVYGVEALIRWKNPKLGFVYPDQFISIAESSGLIYSIGLWVIEKALSDIEMLNKELGLSLSVAVNLSATQLQSNDFSENLKSLLQKFELINTKLNLEITENQLMGKLDSVLPTLNKIKSMGIDFAIDDFGTGYSSLSYLKRLPVSTIKIDKSFVMDIDNDEEDKMIVSAIISLAQSLNKDVIAEGAEKKEHVELLRQMKCNYIQGYYFAKPLQISELKDYLVEKNEIIIEAMF